MRSTSSGRWAAVLRAYLADLGLDPGREAAIVEELAQHLEERYEELRAAGSDDVKARHLALDELRESGDLASRMRALTQTRSPAPVVPGQPVERLFGGLWQDVRLAARLAWKQPGFTATVVVTLALGIAVNTLVFTIVNAAVLRPLPFDDPDGIVRLSVNTGNAQNPIANLSYLDVQDWQGAERTFEHIAAADDRMVDLSGDQQAPVRLEASYISWNLLPLLRVPPALGRGFTAADDRPGAPLAAIIGSDLWRTRYAADGAVLGRTIRIDGAPATIVGVMPPGFGFPNRAQLWVPVAARSEEERTSREARTLDAVGRLHPGVTLEQARAELAGIASVLAERFPDTNRNVTPRVEPASIAPPIVGVLVAMIGAVGFVLLIACANVANLLLARAADRARDVTLRLALGASRWRIVRQLLTESLLIAAVAGIVGLALSHAGLQMFLANVGPEAAPPSWVQFTLDRVVFAYLAALCLGSTLVCGLVPAWSASRPDLVAGLNDAGRTDTGSRSRHRWTGAFVVAQVALALVLLTGATLMAHNLVGLLRIDIGVNPGEVLQTGFVLQRGDYTPERRLLFFQRLEERLSSSTGIHAALASSGPMAGALVRRVRVEGQPASDANALPVVSVVDVGERYFDVLDVPLVSGRVFHLEDATRLAEQVVVNERFARMSFQNGPTVGRRILLLPPNPAAEGLDATPWMTIVGVVGDVRQRMLPSRDFDPVVYRSYTADPPRPMQVLARSTAGPAAVATVVRSQVQALDPDLPLFPVATIAGALAEQFWPQRVFGSLFFAFAAVALALATCGLYAVTSYAVSRRTREIGVRVALGADTRRVWWTVTAATLRQLGVGVALGAAGAAAVSAVLPALMVGEDRWNPWVFGGVALVLLATGLLATAVPARRATRVPPTVALQAE